MDSKLVWACLEFGDTFEDTFVDTLLVWACSEFGDTFVDTFVDTLLVRACSEFGDTCTLIDLDKYELNEQTKTQINFS